MSERTEELERVLVARAICRTGKFPTAKILEAEKRLTMMDAAHGKAVEPIVTPESASAFLRALGLAVPAREKPARDFG